jgi:chromodomain-helicase-DNA-binding protein 1
VQSYGDDNQESESDFGEEDDGYEYAPAVVEEEGDVIDQVMDHRFRSGDDGQEDDLHRVLELCIKWKNYSNLHNTWDAYESLRDFKGFKKVENYAKLYVRYGNVDKDATFREQSEVRRQALEDYTTVERIFDSRGDDPVQYYVKWKSLPYEHSTWEDEDAVSAKFQDRIDDFLNRNSATTIPHRSQRYDAKGRKAAFRRLTEQPAYITEGKLRGYQLEGVSWLAYCWSTNTNGIFLA